MRIYHLAMSLEVGQVFAGYMIMRVLGAGGMGTVYLARHPRLPREDALKVLPADLTTDRGFRARFEREAELAAGLSHPHIVRIHDRGEENGQFWISMDYVPGTDAAVLLRQQYPGGMPPNEVVPIITAVGSALDYAHNRGLLHRDVKPANVLVTDPDGQGRRVYLADFGVARRMDDAAGLTATNMTLGTVAYAAPEQLKGEPVDGRADQYALACTAFHLLTGTPPYGNTNPAVVITQHVSAPPPSIGAVRPELSALDPVFATAMAKEPSGRFGSCQEFTDQLSRCLSPRSAHDSGIPFPTTPPALVVTPHAPVPSPAALQVGERPRRRARVLIGALGAIALLVAGGVFGFMKLTQHHNPGGTTAPNAATAPPKSAALNTGPLTGVYTVRFDQGASLNGVPVPEAKPLTDTYAFRSVCGSAGCVATATRLSGEMRTASSAVFDQVGGHWVSVTVESGTCKDVAGEVWEVFALEPRPDGTLVGEYRGVDPHLCAGKRPVTFTRTSDVDVNSLPDPATLPPRVASPAEALHGHFRWMRTFKDGKTPKMQDGPAVVTDCLRTGVRCMSYFHSGSSEMALVFGGGNWTMDGEGTQDAPGCGGTVNIKMTAQYPLPQPATDPITLLAGHGHLNQSGSVRASCKVNTDFDDTYTRTGD
jgi:tRNA A-37 threonylcarbamoyl transferase component Bud32